MGSDSVQTKTHPWPTINSDGVLEIDESGSVSLTVSREDFANWVGLVGGLGWAGWVFSGLSKREDQRPLEELDGKVLAVESGGFSPTSGHYRQLVTITGSGFTGTTSVRFNGRQAVFDVISDVQVRARVPSGAGTGPIRVSNAAGSDVSGSVFRFLRRQHRVVVSMQLTGHLRATGRIRVPDSSPVAVASSTATTGSGSATSRVATAPSWRRRSRRTTVAGPT